jgi:hypothetical protein
MFLSTPWIRALWMLATAWLVTLLTSVANAQREPSDAPRLGNEPAQLAPLPNNFDTFESDWLHLAYPASEARWVEPLVGQANEFRAELSARLGQPVLRDVHVRLAEDPAQMASLAPIGAPYPKYAVGVAYSKLGLILLTVQPVQSGGEHDLLETFRHELAHVALHEAIDGHAVPLWLNEGLAVHLSRENAFARVQTLWTAAVSGNLLPLHEIERRFPQDLVGVPLAYAQSADIVRFLLRQQDQERFVLLIKRVRRGQNFDEALYDSYGVDTHGLEYNWRENVEGRYSIWPMLFSGTVIWVAAIGLVVVAWRRKRRRQKLTMDRWAKEEALEEMRLRLPPQSAEVQVAPWMVATAREDGEMTARAGPTALSRRDSLVPKVEHDGDWHTLH